MSRRTFHAWGSVRGACGHVHLAPVTAMRCAEKDARAVARHVGGGAYSDRTPRVLAAGDGPDYLTDEECRSLEGGAR